MIANVPHEVPVEKAIKELIIKTTAGNNSGDSQPFVTFAIYTPVSSSLQASPIAKASNINNARGISSLIPFNVSATASLGFIIPCIKYIAIATNNAVITAYKTAEDPEPFPIASIA